MITRTHRIIKARIFWVLLILLMTGSGCLTVQAKTEISYIQATATPSINSYKSAYAQPITRPTFTVESGSPAYFSVDGGNGWWYRLKDGEDPANPYSWEQITSGDFSAGTWHFMCQVRIDGDSENVLAENVSVRVNGISWKTEKVFQSDTYSCVFIKSPDIILTDDGNYHVLNSSRYDIEDPVAGDPISVFSVKDAVAGGKPPYTFSWNGGPQWLKVSKDGQVSGTPEKAGDNGNLVVNVSDADHHNGFLSVKVYPTTSGVREVSGTAGIEDICQLDKTVKIPSVSINSPESVEVDLKEGWWEKYDDKFKSWTAVLSGTFTKGKWRYCSKLKIKSDLTNSVRFSSALKVKLDGNTWTEINREDRKRWVQICSETITLPIPAVSEKPSGGESTSPGSESAVSAKKLKKDLPKVGKFVLTAKTKGFKAKWKKPKKKTLAKIQGYEIQYSRYSSFKKSRTKIVKKGKTSVKIRKLKRRKVYYVRIRYFREEKDTLHVSKWVKKKIRTR